jgi:hypothetical protein
MLSCLVGLEPDTESVVETALTTRGCQRVPSRVDIHGLAADALVDVQGEILVQRDRRRAGFRCSSVFGYLFVCAKAVTCLVEFFDWQKTHLDFGAARSLCQQIICDQGVFSGRNGYYSRETVWPLLVERCGWSHRVLVCHMTQYVA